MMPPHDIGPSGGPDPAEDRIPCAECGGLGPWDEEHCGRCEELFCSWACRAAHMNDHFNEDTDDD